MASKPTPVTKADLRLSKRHAKQTIATDKKRIREHGALAKKERANKAAHKEEMWHVRRHQQDLTQERKYLKRLNKVKPKKGTRRGK